MFFPTLKLPNPNHWFINEVSWNPKIRYDIDNKEYGRDPTVKVEKSIEAAKIKADQMFFEVLGRKDRADATRNALNVMNRFKFLFYLPANIEANIAKGKIIMQKTG